MRRKTASYTHNVALGALWLLACQSHDAPGLTVAAIQGGPAQALSDEDLDAECGESDLAGALLSEEAEAECGQGAEPILTVADFDGDGVVRPNDLAMLAAELKTERYSAFHDRDADGELDACDLVAARLDLRKTSTALDREKVAAYGNILGYDRVTGTELLATGDWLPGTSPLRGHGMHWIRRPPPGLPVGLGHPLRFDDPIGLNVYQNDGRAHGAYYAAPAIPLFDNGAGGLDTQGWPDETQPWTDKVVQAFMTSDGTLAGIPLTPDLHGGGPPQPVRITSSHHEVWHTHAGFCVTTTTSDFAVLAEGRYCDLTRPEEECLGFIIHDYTTWNECQSLPSEFKNPGNKNVWLNIWMVHAWFFDLNPNGFFGGTHPCADPEALAVRPHGLDGQRHVPAFFAGGHHH